MTLFGISIIPSPLMTETVVVERRVRGGYMNRWLIRAFIPETRPSRNFIHDRLANRIFCHPSIVDEIRRAFEVGHPALWRRP